MARRERLPRKTTADTEVTRRKVDQIVRLVVDADRERDRQFQAIAASEILRLRRSATRSLSLAGG